MLRSSRPVTLIVGALAAACASTGASACSDRPGTPTDVTVAISSTMPPRLHVHWINTASERVFWDVEISDGAGNVLAAPPGIGRGDQGVGLPVSNTYDVEHGATRCFRVRARTERHTEGCVSELWSNRACATTPDCSYGPGTCQQGFVWREASATDRVCVRPEIRQQVREDNALAGTRREPNGGAWGPDTCRQGFVWREAFEGDLVCVVPERRSQALADNQVAATRNACP